MTTTANLNVTKIDGSQNQPGVTSNTAFDIFDAALSQLTKALPDSNYTLIATGATPQEWQYGTLHFTGTLGAGRNIIVPNNKKAYIIWNGTTQTLTVKTAAGTGIAVATNKHAIVRCDGTNVVRVTADT